MTLTERERQAVESGNARGCIMCRRIVEAWVTSDGLTHPDAMVPREKRALLRDWRDEVVTFDVQAQKFHVEGEVRTQEHL